jgi:hypothetical protein
MTYRRVCINCNGSNLTDLYNEESKETKIRGLYYHKSTNSKLAGYFCKDCGITVDFQLEGIKAWIESEARKKLEEEKKES